MPTDPSGSGSSGSKPSDPAEKEKNKKKRKMNWESLTNPDAKVRTIKSRSKKNRKYILNNRKNSGIGNFIAELNTNRSYKLRLR